MSKIGWRIGLVNQKVDTYVRNMPGPKPTFTERITFRSAPDMRAKLKAWAEANGMTEQNAIRQAIALLLKRRTRPQAQSADSNTR